MKLHEGKVYGESRDPQVIRERTRGRKPRGIVVKAPRDQFIANLTVELLMEWFSSRSVEPNHFECDDRAAPPLLTELLIYNWFHNSDCAYFDSTVFSAKGAGSCKLAAARKDRGGYF